MILGNAITPFKFTPSGGIGILLQDTIGGFSFSRRLDDSYSGNLIKVRRDSDNTTLDIGVDGSGNLDESALTTFVGAGNGYIHTLYGQSATAINLTQTTDANQPRIVNSGTVDKSNGKPAAYFDGTNDYLISTTPLNGGTKPTDYSVFAVYQTDYTTGANRHFFASMDGGGFSRSTWAYMKHDNVNIFHHEMGDDTNFRRTGTTTNPVTNGVQGLLQVTYSSGDTYPNIYHNGGAALGMSNLAGTATSSAGTEYNFALAIAGQWVFGHYKGYFNEIILKNVESSDRTDIRDNINTYYSTY